MGWNHLHLKLQDSISSKTICSQLPLTKSATSSFVDKKKNPAGLVYSRRRCEELIEVMRSTKIPIIEDDAYGELYYDKEGYERSRPMKTWVDTEIDSQILYTGLFSKIFGPGLRVAWALVSEVVYEKMQICKQSIDACTPTIS